VAGEDFCHVGIGGMSAQDRDQHVAEVGRDRQIAGADEGVANGGLASSGKPVYGQSALCGASQPAVPISARCRQP
jgi:hypothetical protein